VFGCPDLEASGVRTFFGETLADELFEVLLMAPVVNGLVPFTVVVGSVLFCSGKYKIVLDCLGRLTYGWSLMALKTLLMGSLSERSALLA